MIPFPFFYFFPRIRIKVKLSAKRDMINFNFLMNTEKSQQKNNFYAILYIEDYTFK